MLPPADLAIRSHTHAPVNLHGATIRQDGLATNAELERPIPVGLPRQTLHLRHMRTRHADRGRFKILSCYAHTFSRLMRDSNDTKYTTDINDRPTKFLDSLPPSVECLLTMKQRKAPKKATEDKHRLQIDVPPELARRYRIDCMTRGTTMRQDIEAYIRSRVDKPK